MIKHGYTMVELLVVIVIISIIAGFGSYNFTKLIMRTHARNAIKNLAVIHGAQLVYKMNNTNFVVVNNLATINTMLGVQLTSSDNSVYVCNNANPPTSCVATASTGAADFQVSISLASPVAVPACTGTYCP